MIGLLLGASTVGLLAGAAGGVLAVLLPFPVRAVLAGTVLAIVVVREISGRPWRGLQNRRLVPQEIIARGNVEGPLQFGFEMGTGMRTFSPSALPHLLVALVVLAGGPAVGAVAGLGFAAGRALVPLSRGSAADRYGWDAALRRQAGWLLRLSVTGFVAALAASHALT